MFQIPFYTKKMQFETSLELHKRLWTTNELTACNKYIVVYCCLLMMKPDLLTDYHHPLIFQSD